MKLSNDMMNNRELFELLESVAAALEVSGGNKFKIVAYKNAADSIMRSAIEARDLWEQGKLEELPGVGKSIALYLDELFKTGKVKHFESVKKNLPSGMFPLLGITGIGPKTAFRLAKHLGINKENTAILKLKSAAKDGKIAKIEGFGTDSQKRILDAIDEWKQKEDRMLLPAAMELGQKIRNYMRKCPGVEMVELLGSLRRKAETVGDIDLAAATKQPKLALDWFTRFGEWREILNRGEISARAIHRSGRQVDLKTESLEGFGTLLAHFTGSRDHNVKLREYAMKRGYSVSEHGVKKTRNGNQHPERLIKFSNEKKFHRFLGLVWIPPELREDLGEIELATKNRLPQLVKTGEIKGDLHVHSNIDVEPSHDLGESSLESLENKAMRLGYEYIAISDHNPSTSRHTNPEIIDIIKYRNESIDKFITSRGKNMKIKILKSLEIDILPSGELAVPDDGLEELDLAIISIHSTFRESMEKQTQRILRAMDHPKVKILGHPTGRQLLLREGIECDWDKVFDFCRKKNIWLEINASPQRLDLPYRLVKSAVDGGIQLVINTDSHDAVGLELMQFGIDVARRGWAKSSDVVNTLGYNELKLKI